MKMKHRRVNAFVLLLCTIASQAQVIDWQSYCASSANKSTGLSIAGFSVKAERFKSATDGDSQLFKEMVKVCTFVPMRLSCVSDLSCEHRVAIWTLKSNMCMFRSFERYVVSGTGTHHLIVVHCSFGIAKRLYGPENEQIYPARDHLYHSIYRK